MRNLTGHLYFWVLLAIVTGGTLGYVSPDTGVALRPLGDGFIALVKMLRDEGLTIIIVEHMMDAIRSLCDRCVVMNSGRRIAEGRPDEVLADPAVIEAYLGVSADA